MRRYNRHHGNLVGVEEDPELCIVEVDADTSNTKQCPERRGYGRDGLYCIEHKIRLSSGRFAMIPKDVE